MNQTLKYIVDKYGVEVTQPCPIELVGIGRLDLLRWLRELNFKTGVEVGVERGTYSHLICEMNTQMKIFGVDPWLKYDEYREYHDQAEMDGIYDAMLYKMRAFIADGQFVPVRKKSMDAVKDFEDESLDFVYIDGNHEAEYPLQDIEEWAKKVRKGGIVAGHDFVRVKVLNFTIKDALEKYTKEHNITPWFVLGRYQKRTGEVRDRTRSWAFIKE